MALENLADKFVVKTVSTQYDSVNRVFTGLGVWAPIEITEGEK